MYVCLLSVYVWLGKIVRQRTRSDSLRKRSVFDVFNQFCEICEGGRVLLEAPENDTYVCLSSMYVCHACMYVCQACMYVCQAGMYVCMPVYVCLGTIMPKRTRFHSLRKTFSMCSLSNVWGIREGEYCRWGGYPKPLCLWGLFKAPLPVGLFQNPSACEAFWEPLCQSGFFKIPLPVMLFSKTLCLSGFLHRHTYIPALHSEALHREKGFEKSSTGRGLVKHTYQHKHTYQLST